MPVPTIVIIGFGLISILGAMIIHEYSHAWMANKLGDPTAKYSGRLTLNPINHFDPIGTTVLIFTFIASVISGGGGICFGWAKPVPINPYNFKDYIKGSMWVGLAGPSSNFILAIISGALIKYEIIPANSFWGLFLVYFILINICLGIFNLLPIPPLDGSKILTGILPKDLAYKFIEFEEKNSKFIMIAIIFILITPFGRIILDLPIALLFGFFTGHKI